MNDETFVFHQDVREKKIAARSAHNKRTHNGKRGSVKFLSDNLTKKELAKMSGEVKAYRLNDPISWDEFKAMPDDMQAIYIKGIRDKFNVPAYKIGEMFGVSAWTMSAVCKRLGLTFPKGARMSDENAKAWNTWCGGIEETAAEQSTLQIEFTETKAVLPCTGNMSFIGTVDDAFDMLRRVLGGAHARIMVAWEVQDNDRDPSK